MRGLRNGRIHLVALLVQPISKAAPDLITELGAVGAEPILERSGLRVLRYSFSLPATADAAYVLGDDRYPVDAAFSDDLQIAYVSCNGQERGDQDRPAADRNAMWQRLARRHTEQPFQLLLHGGDQIYADEILEAHPAVHAWAEGDRAGPDEGATVAEVRETLRQALFARYLQVHAHRETAWLMARVPSLAMWDDHDICDGWGSLPAAKLDSPVGRAVFDVAREHFRVFQLGAAPDESPNICTDPSGASLSWHVPLPGVSVIAPDLRSERRRDRVMGQAGWTAFHESLEAAEGSRILLLSSVPALGPRLSWVEAGMRLTRRMEKYEDDLRDQWQSRTHRAEWRAFLQRLVDTHQHDGTRVTVLSGEIHLATRGALATSAGPLHQLVASGIAHPPPPKAYARALSALARLGESPLPGHPIRLHPMPGQPAIYTAQRNYLVLERLQGRWRAWWELEDDGATDPLELD